MKFTTLGDQTPEPAASPDQVRSEEKASRHNELVGELRSLRESFSKLEQHLIQLGELVGKSPPTAETANPGPVGQDTGHVFEDPKTGEEVRVIAKEGEDHQEAISRVRENHDLPG